MSTINSTVTLIALFFIFLQFSELKANNNQDSLNSIPPNKVEKNNQLKPDSLQTLYKTVSELEDIKTTAFNSMKGLQQVFTGYLNLFIAIVTIFLGYNFFDARKFKKTIENIVESNKRNKEHVDKSLKKISEELSNKQEHLDRYLKQANKELSNKKNSIDKSLKHIDQLSNNVEREYEKLFKLFKKNKFENIAFLSELVEKLTDSIEHLDSTIIFDITQTDNASKLVPVKEIMINLVRKLQILRLSDNTNIKEHKSALDYLGMIGRGSRDIEFLDGYIEQAQSIELIKSATRASTLIEVRNKNEKEKNINRDGKKSKKITVREHFQILQKEIGELKKTIELMKDNTSEQ